MKKTYIHPSIKAFPIIQTDIICGSGGTSESLSTGSGSQPTATQGSSGLGIYGEAKESFFDDEDYNDEW